MNLWDKLINYITDKYNRRRIILWFLAFVLLITVVFFGKDIQDFFKSLQGRAMGPPGTELEWDLLEGKSLSESVAHAQLVEVNHNGYRHIYRIGGVHRAENGEGNYISKKVERIELDSEGKPASGSDWATNSHWGEMYSGHAEFGAFQYGDYLYVVAGDIHLPNLESTDDRAPLVFSTIERLDLNKLKPDYIPESQEERYWEAIAKVAGVNFYPEIKIYNGKLHIIGGLYGLPKATAESWGGGTPAIGGDARWKDEAPFYRDLPTIGSEDLIILPKAGVGANIKEGGPVTEDYAELLGIEGGGYQIGGSGVAGNGGTAGYPQYEYLPDEYQKNITNVSKLLSDSLLSGDYATTVSEHYIIDIDSMATDNLMVELASELGNESSLNIETSGNDYEGTLFDTWEIGKVAHIEHLRVVLDTTWWDNGLTGADHDAGNILDLYPALQGRYGHEVIEQNGKIHTVGGASWTSTIERQWLPEGQVEPSSVEINTFWAVDDKGHPVNKLFSPSTLQSLDYEYNYIGNTVYRLHEGTSVTYWQGTNQESNTSFLDEDFAMPIAGQAFFGFSKYNYSSGDGEAKDHLILGGLANNNTANGYEDEPALRVFVLQDGENLDPYYLEPSEGVWPDNPPANWPEHWPWFPTKEGPAAGWSENSPEHWLAEWGWPPDQPPTGGWPDLENYPQLQDEWEVCGWGWPPNPDEPPLAGWPQNPPANWYDTWGWPPNEDGPDSGWPSNPPPEWLEDYPDADWPPVYGENDFPSGSTPPEWWPSNWPWNEVIFPPPVTADYAIGVSIKVVDWSAVFKDDDSGWVIQPSLDYAVYGMHSFNVGDAVIVFGGKQMFQPAPDFPFEDRHIPDYECEEVYQTFMYKNGVIYLMHNVEEHSSEYATLAVKTPIPDSPAGEYTYIYKAGGTLDKLNHTTKTVEFLGRFDMGMTGVIDTSKSTIEIVPLRDDEEGGIPVVRADHFDYATVTVTLRDYYGDPITLPDDIPEGTGITLCTNRSIKPAVERDVGSQVVKDHKNSDGTYDLGFEPRLDHIQALGNVFSGEQRNPDWPDYWDDQVAVVDRTGGTGGGDDNNTATGIGQVQFRISTRTGHDSNPLNTLVDPIMVKANLINAMGELWGIKLDNDAPVIFSRHGYPHPKESKIYANNVQLTAENNYSADINAEARDYWGDEVTDISVLLKSARNEGIADPADYPDKIDPADLVEIDEDGNMVFSVESGAHGVMQLRVYYEAYIAGRTNIDGTITGPKVRGYITLVLDTKGRIVSILPDFGYQGETMLNIELIGELTNWRDDIEETDDDKNTEVKFIPPNKMEFYYWHDDNGTKVRITTDGLVMAADGSTNYSLSVDANPGDEIELTILEDESVFTIEGGTFLPPVLDQFVKKMTVYAGYEFQADFGYRVGINAGILKIHAHNITADTEGELWIPVAGDYSNLELRLEANPISVSVGEQTQILAIPHINGFPVSNPADTISDYSYYIDDTESVLENPHEYNGLFDIDYRRVGSDAGRSHIFIIAKYGLEEELMVGTITIQKPLEGAEAAETIIPSSFDVDPENEINISNVAIGASANLGLWTIATSTLIYDEITEESRLYNESILFRVVDENYNPDGQYIDVIDPEVVYRGETPILEITGINTNFVPTEPNKSTVIFKRVVDDIMDQHTLEAEIISGSTLSLQVELELEHDVPLGFYDIIVSTPIADSDPEVVEKLNHRDLWVTTNKNDYFEGYFIDMIADPAEVLRDGESTSEVSALVGHADYASGDIEYLASKLVEFDWYQGDNEGGGLDPSSDTTEDIDGVIKAITEYTSDFGLENDIVKIQGITILEEYGNSGEISNYVVIEKLGHAYHDPDVDAGQTRISATSPVPTSDDGSDFSVVTVTVYNTYFVPLENYLVDLSTNRTEDTIRLSDGSLGSSTETNEDGKAMFQVSSTAIGISTVTAAISDFEISATISFEDPNSLVPRILDITVPFQSRDYDNLVLVCIAEVQTGGDLLECFNEIYTKSPRPPDGDDKLTDLNQILLYFHPDETYNIWAKGRNHLARKQDFFPGSITEQEIVVIDMTNTEGKGLWIGDLVPDNRNDGSGNMIPSPFHDNRINTLDFGLLFSNFFSEDFDLGDLLPDDLINNLDLGYMFQNYGHHDIGGPPPYNEDE